MSKCRQSKGELACERTLQKLQIDHIPQYVINEFKLLPNIMKLLNQVIVDDLTPIKISNSKSKLDFKLTLT